MIINKTWAKALKGAIRKWRNIAYAMDMAINDESEVRLVKSKMEVNCPLCNVGRRDKMNCSSCPICLNTGSGMCINTPYKSAEEAVKDVIAGGTPAEKRSMRVWNEVWYLENIWYKNGGRHLSDKL